METKPIDTRAVALKKVETALQAIEHAQEWLSRASGELHSLQWAAPQWRKVGDAYDTVKGLWHEVNETIPRWKVDLDPDARRRYLSQADRKQ